MSSAKHQPKIIQRPIDESAPEFPCLPFFFFDSIRDFARESQEALYSIGNISPDVDWLYLPLISPLPLHERFNVGDDHSVFVVMRKSYACFKNAVENFNVRNQCGMYLYGPAGVGKSYLLYLLAAEYRLNRSTHRVTYINDCYSWEREEFHLSEFLAELVTTFYDDDLSGESIVDLCEAVKRSCSKEEEYKTLMLLHTLVDYISAHHLEWIVICDQYSVYNTASVAFHRFPFNHIAYLANNRQQNIKVILSASANNEKYLNNLRGWQKHDITSHRFDETEFKTWCDHYLLEDDVKVIHDSEEAADALFWTGGVPYELNSLWKKPRQSLIEKTAIYRDRALVMEMNHRQLYPKLSDKRKSNLDECISRMALSLSPPKMTIGMDRQLFVITTEVNGSEIITTLNPSARKALITHHGCRMVSSIHHHAELVFREGYTNHTQRTIFKYITTILEISKRFTFNSIKVKKTSLSLSRGKSKCVEIQDVVHFSEHHMPPKSSFKSNVTTLFIPGSENGTGSDFFLWNSKSKSQVLMAFRVTVDNAFGAMSDFKEWQEFCSGTAQETPIERYWVIPGKSVENSTASVNDPVILFEDLIADFPALQKLRL